VLKSSRRGDIGGEKGVKMLEGVLRRRDLLKLSAAAGAATLLGACLPEAPSATPATKPAPTVAAPPPATVAPTSAPAAAPTTQVAATPAATQAVSAAATPASAAKYALGKLEGPAIVTDASKFPKTLKEAPELAALVQQGKLPAVAERVGQDPLVVQPVHEVGKYGGTMHKVFFGGINDLSIARFMTGQATLLAWDYQWKTIQPNIARAYDVNADNTVVTVHLRRGMKWSDGEPFTADDIMFWSEDVFSNDEIHSGGSPDLSIGGQPVVIEKVDDATVRFVSPQANLLLVEIMASPDTDIGATIGQQRGLGGPYAPKHYLQKFHAKYIGKDAADKLAADNNQNGWATYFKSLMQYDANPDLPVIFPWVVKTPATDPTSFVIERNPYSVWVDTDGNQLPYIGTVQHANVQGTDVMALKATSGELDFMELQFTVSQLPVLVQNQETGNYKVYLDPEQAGVGIALNLAYDEDATLGELYRNVDFRRALSMAIDRDQINETFFLGSAVPSSMAPSSDNKFFPGDEWRTKWATLDIAQANQLLDKIGLTQKDSAGYRLRKDGKRVQLAFMAVDRIVDQASLAEMLKTFWQKIGVDLTTESASTNLAQERIGANQAQMTINSVGTEDVYLSTGFQTPIGGGFSRIMGVPYGQWANTGGKEGKEPFAEMKQALDLFEQGKAATSVDERISIGKELTKLVVDQVFAIGLVGSDLSLGIRIAKNNVGNIPARSLNAITLLSPVGALAQTYYFK
jgi:peptide/nickel transport system substrate-binding protein